MASLLLAFLPERGRQAWRPSMVDTFKCYRTRLGVMRTCYLRGTSGASESRPASAVIFSWLALVVEVPLFPLVLVCVGAFSAPPVAVPEILAAISASSSRAGRHSGAFDGAPFA